LNPMPFVPSVPSVDSVHSVQQTLCHSQLM
jgi:hypothetical protein